MRRVGPLIGGVFAAALGAASAGAQICDRPADSLSGSRDLYCVTLLPVPDLDTLRGILELTHVPTPFTVLVTADGRPAYRPIVHVSGLPAPDKLGPYTTYVAWAATPVMYPVEKLGVVSNGRTQLGRVDLDPFVLIITAESSDSASMPSGRVVLRGGSPSTRLQPPDLMQFSIGAVREEPGGHDSGGTAMPGMPGMTGAKGRPARFVGTDTVAWDTVPMVPGVSMLPAEMALRPTVQPYLPTPPAGAPPLPFAHPNSMVHLANGDTLHLTAAMVRRRIRGHVVTAFAFNGQYPGPLISVAQGSDVVIDFTNHLDQPSTVHWHGIRLDAPYDGVPDISQPAVPPDGHFFYHVRFPDAGVYWYHPHVREDVQQALGLFGAMIVKSPRSDYLRRADREEVLMLDDVLVTDRGLVPFGRDASTHALMGRFGNVLLVNGEPRYALTVRRGEVVQFDIANASSARTFNVSFPGARLKLVGTDAGPFEREMWVDNVVIAPAERYLVQVRFDHPGVVRLVNRVRGLDHLFGRFVILADTLGAVRVEPTAARSDPSASFDSLHVSQAAREDIERYRRYFDRPVDRTLVLSLETHGLPFVSRQLMQLDSLYFTPVEWAGTMPNMNWAATTKQVDWVLRDPATGKTGMDIGWTFHRGDVIKLRLVNARGVLHGMQHPIHIHGQRFLVLDVNGIPNEDLAWKDTVLVPAGSAVDILVDLANPGRWMLHCHIAEHLAANMMTVFTVTN